MLRVSVIIPVFNQEPYLAECLDSVLGQTLREIEVICVDDGSTDASGVLLDRYAGRDGRIKVIHQENAGPGAARNCALDIARGEFVAFMDPDDRYPDSQVLDDLYRGAVDHGVPVCCGGMSAMNGEKLEPEFSFAQDGMVDYANYQFEFGYVRALFRRSLLAEANIRFPDLKRFQDVPFFVLAMRAVGTFYALSRSAYMIRLGHHDVDWTANGCRKALDNVTGLIMVYDLAHEYGYELMAARIRKRLLHFTEHIGERSNRIQRQLDDARKEVADIKAGVSFRLGMFLTAPLRKVKRLLKGSR